jgi:hypothetical protein
MSGPGVSTRDPNPNTVTLTLAYYRVFRSENPKDESIYDNVMDCTGDGDGGPNVPAGGGGSDLTTYSRRRRQLAGKLSATGFNYYERRGEKNCSRGENATRERKKKRGLSVLS